VLVNKERVARSVRMRALRGDDHAAFLALWAVCDGVEIRTWEDAADLARLIERNPSLCCVAEVAGSMVSTLLCGHHGWRGWLYHLEVNPAFRRLGIANSMVNRAMMELSKVGVRRVHTLVLSGNRDAMQFWSASGWRQREDLSMVSIEFSAATLN